MQGWLETLNRNNSWRPYAALLSSGWLFLEIVATRLHSSCRRLMRLAGGVDSPSLRNLAAMSTRGVLSWSLSDVVAAVSSELGRALPPPHSGAAKSLALRELCRQLDDGLITARVCRGLGSSAGWPRGTAGAPRSCGAGRRLRRPRLQSRARPADPHRGPNALESSGILMIRRFTRRLWATFPVRPER
jgi:hypothetical protein